MEWWEIVIIVLLALVAVLAVLYFVGRKLQKKQNEANSIMEKTRQYVDALVIEKKKMKLEDAHFPKAAIDQTPKFLRGRKWPMAKVKVGPQIVTLICDGKIYKTLPTNKLVRLEISGAYITGYGNGKNGSSKPGKAAPKNTKKAANDKAIKNAQNAKTKVAAKAAKK